MKNTLTRKPPPITVVLHLGGDLCHLDHHLSNLLQSTTTTYSGWNRPREVELRKYGRTQNREEADIMIWTDGLGRLLLVHCIIDHVDHGPYLGQESL